MNNVRTRNPHWVGDFPAWDITLSNGEVHKDVTEKEIRVALSGLFNKGLASHSDIILDVVRQRHIDLYNKFHTEELH